MNIMWVFGYIIDVTAKGYPTIKTLLRKVSSILRKIKSKPHPVVQYLQQEKLVDICKKGLIRDPFKQIINIFMGW